MANVTLTDVRNVDITRAVESVFASAGGARALLKSSRDVYIKVNAIDFKPNVFTDPALVAAVVRLFKDNGARRVFVIENCTQGNFTRLVFDAIGMFDTCRRNGARAVCLDETKSTPVKLPHIDSPAAISSFVHDRLITRREENLYVNIPLLKTHSMSQVTLGVKNQFGFLDQRIRMYDHNFMLHRKIADVYHLVQPDFTLIDARNAMNHGHYIPSKFTSECVIPVGLFIGSADTLAADVVGARLMGYDVDRVEHLRLLKEDGAGCADIGEMRIDGAEYLAERALSLTHELKDAFPEKVKIIRGAERCCAEGCRRNTEAALEVFANDMGCPHPFTIFMGRGHSPEALDSERGPALVVGDCAIEECAVRLERRLGRGRVLTSPGCNNLADTAGGLISLMGLSTVKIAPMHPLRALALLITARLRGSHARVTRILPRKVKR